MKYAFRTPLAGILLIFFVACSGETVTSSSPEKNLTATSASTAKHDANLVVHKSPTCGCCGAWVDHVKTAGFSAGVVEDSDLQALKDRFGIAPQTRSCHTAIYNDEYVFEGHVPPASMSAFLSNPPLEARGLVVPGMPIGSAGMEDGDRFQPFQVLQLNKDGSYVVYATIENYEQQF